MFPEIIPLFQNPTNATLSGNIFLCQNNNGDCRVNLTLDPIFTGAYLSRDYLCEVSTGSIVLSTCNPNTLSFRSDGKIEIALREQSHSGNLIQKEYRVKFVGEPLSLSSGRNSIDTTPPVIIIELDKQTKNYYEQINDNEFNCYTNTCTVNLTAQRSYDPDGSPIHFLWMYDMENLSVSHDP